MKLLLAGLGLLALAAAGAPGTAARAAGGCAPYIKTTVAANGTTESKQQLTEKPLEKGNPCWVQEPYPFVEENEVEPGVKTVTRFRATSLAFRAWNRGLAATTGGVWIFNGERWYPNPSFPGSGECPGETVLWAGKLDYWLVGPGPNFNWPNICRYDGETHEWIPVSVPRGHPSGGITSGACYAWNDCSFFGSYGVVLHWNGERLTDVSPNPSEGWLLGEYSAAVATQDAAGDPLGVAVGDPFTTDRQSDEYPPVLGSGGAAPTLPNQPNGLPAPQIYGSRGGPFTPFEFPPPPAGHPTDFVAVGLGHAGQGWIAGNPAGLRARLGGTIEFNESTEKPVPSPLVPISTSGAAGACPGPPESRFTYSQNPALTEPAGSYLWSSLALIPGTEEALVGGLTVEHGFGVLRFTEAIIVRALCGGATTATQLLNSEGKAPQPPENLVSAIAANASNDAWAAIAGQEAGEPLRLYRFTDGQPPDAPSGNDLESRPPELEQDKPIFEFIPPKEEAPPPPPPPIVSQTPSSTLPPAVYDVKVKLHTAKRRGRTYLSLYLTFKVRRSITLGAQALRHGRVVSVARAKTFSGRTGQLILNVERKRWPTSVQFTT
jgi:hypothetical protein